MDAKQAQSDRTHLRALVSKLDAMEAEGSDEFDENYDSHARAFRDMLVRLERGRILSLKQRGYMLSIYEKLIGEPEYLNLASSGNLCRGREVETPDILRPENLPKFPPKRKISE